MAVRIVRLGTARSAGEGLRIGTVRRPPRGVPRSKFAKDNWYDVWYPNLAPSPQLVRLAKKAKTERDWNAFAKKYRAEMAAAENARTLALLAALSHRADFSLGCYCLEESRCHRSVLQALLAENGARLA